MSESQLEKKTSLETRLGDGDGNGDNVALGVDDAGAIPKGTMDPVYEAKARVLNRAVGCASSIMVFSLTCCRSKR